MSDYASPPPKFDPAKAAERKLEIERAAPITIGDPAFRHHVEVRGIPAEVVLGCADLLLLRPPIPGQAKTQFGVVSLLRPAPGVEPTGAEIAFVDRAGHKTSDRRTWAFVERGCVRAWFWAGGSGDRAIACEGFAAKPLAALAAGLPGIVVGWGSRSWLPSKGKLPATIRRMLIANDRRPGETELGADGESLCAGHDRDVRRGADRWLLELGEGAVEIAADPGELGKDLDEVLRTHGAGAVRDLLEQTSPASLSEDGWIKKLAGMGRLEYERQREDLAKELGGVRLSTLDAMRKQGQAAGLEEDDAARSRLVAIALGSDLFRDSAGDAYACIELEGGALRTFRVDSSSFDDWLLAEYGRQYPTTIAGRQIPGTVSGSTLIDARRSITAVARQGETRAVFIRLGWAMDRLYLDMATDVPRAIEITPDGWSIVVDPPVHLVYSPTLLPLPTPVPGTSKRSVLKKLGRYLGFRPTDERVLLLVGLMLAGLMAKGPYPIGLLSGEHGAGKSTRAKLIKTAIDPARGSARGSPKTCEDLVIAVWRSWFPVFDNLSKLDQLMSDWLCRLSEGGALPKRKLYTDHEEILIEASRPVVLTAIPDIARSGDLVDRSVFIRCDPLETKLREQVLQDELEAFHPELLTYLIEAASGGLRRFADQVDSHDGLRRGDWCAWVEACATELGWRPGRFTAAYRRNQDQAVRLALEVDPVSAAAIEYMQDRTEAVEAGVSVLHSALETIARRQHSGRLPIDWPSMSHHFSGRLRRVAPMLRRLGIEVTHSGHTRTGTTVRLTNTSLASVGDLQKRASQASRASPPSAGRDARDACDAHFPGSPTPAREASSPGNGIDGVVDEVVAGTRCGFCAGQIDGEAAEQIGDRWYHAEACAAEHRRRPDPAPSSLATPPAKRKPRVRRGKPA